MKWFAVCGGGIVSHRGPKGEWESAFHSGGCAVRCCHMVSLVRVVLEHVGSCWSSNVICSSPLNIKITSSCTNQNYIVFIPFYYTITSFFIPIFIPFYYTIPFFLSQPEKKQNHTWITVFFSKPSQKNKNKIYVFSPQNRVK